MSTSERSLYAHLPALYAAVGDDAEPFAAVLTLWYGAYHELEDLRGSANDVFDPRKASDHPTCDFLSWLARWVALDPTDDMFVGDAGGPERRRLRTSIEQATRLYARRGTAGGLRDLVELFLGEKVTVQEWTWPVGLTIGQASTVGVDTLLTDDPALDACFIVRWQLPSSASAEHDGAVSWWRTTLAGRDRRDVVFNAIVGGPGAAARVPWFPQVSRLRRLLDAERPAHTACFLALEIPGAGDRSVVPEVMIIGVSSTVGLCWIEEAA